ncbi:hypothetical protein BASA83_013810 [Batrachochytrium salamandrivorans]|nr:hypothetical protein BASA83_013810 [Batrachochytrium salamandrivorans]
MKKQLEEGVEQGMEDYRAILGEYWDMRHRESNLETGLFQARKILIKQIDDACEDIDTVSVLEVETETQLNHVYEQLMTPGSDKNALRTHYIEANQMFMDSKDKPG